MILAENEVVHFDTDWGGFLGWCDTMPVEESTIDNRGEPIILWDSTRCPGGRGYFWQAATQI